MGYTHYWEFKVHDRGHQSKVEAQYQKAVSDCKKIVARYQRRWEKGDWNRLSGVTAHAPQYMGVQLNGTGDLAHETFWLRDHYRTNDPFNFCKTAQKPYDEVVTACLIVLKHRLPNHVDVSSDGEEMDWLPGLLLATQSTRLKCEIPQSIHYTIATTTLNIVKG